MSRSKKEGTHAKKPDEIVQERARVTRETLIRAASSVFWTKGYHDAQTPEIAAVAGVSVGTFYRYFRDKRDILLEIATREIEEAHREVLTMLTPDRFMAKDRRGAISAAIHILTATVARQPERHRLFIEMALRDPDFAAVKRRYDEGDRKILAEMIKAVCPEGMVSDPEATAYMMHVLLSECALGLAGVYGDQPVSRERGMAALGEIVDNALFGPKK